MRQSEAIAEGKDPESIVILWNQDKTEIVGYCMLSVDDKGYGGLGPIGIAKKSGEKHVGDYILNQSLQQLRKIGAVRVNIDWTILKDFTDSSDSKQKGYIWQLIKNLINKGDRKVEDENCIIATG